MIPPQNSGRQVIRTRVVSMIGSLTSYSALIRLPDREQKTPLWGESADDWFRPSRGL
jgi:hypothetical protein